MGKRVIEVPEELASLGDAVEKLIAEAKTKMAAAQSGEALDVAKVERTMEKLAADAEREALRGLLQALDIDAPLVTVEGKAFAKVGRYEGSYQTKAGAVNVTRSLYREVGKRNAKTVDAVSLSAGVVEEGWLPETAKAMALLIQNGTSREAESIARETGRLPYSRSSFERVGHAVAARYGANREAIDRVLIERLIIPPEARSVSLSMDRAALPMEELKPRPVGKPKAGAPKRPVSRNWRMAYCATVTFHDGQGSALQTIRYGRMPQRDAQELCSRIGADLRVALTASRSSRWCSSLTALPRCATGSTTR
jgi:hypothetical protein